MNEVEITFSRSSGPGGQNVNVVNTKVDLRIKLDKASFITEKVKAKIIEEVSFKLLRELQIVNNTFLTCRINTKSPKRAT